MNKTQKEFLKKLIEAPSPSGYEWPAGKVYKEYIKEHVDTVETDVMGSVTAIKNPNGKPRVMLAAHIDEIGLIVRYIDDKGYLYFDQIGGIDPGVLPGCRVYVHTDKGPILGVIGKVAVHMLEKEDRGKNLKLDDLWIDLGAKDKKEAEKLVQIGDPVTVTYSFDELAGQKAVSRAFDDKAGVYVMAEVMRMLHDKQRKAGVYASATTQEELGLRGARACAFSIDAQVGIAVDVTHAIDHPGASKTKFGGVEIGKGPVLHRGGNITPKVEKKLLEAAKATKVPFQIEASGCATGTDANIIQMTRNGIATGLVSIPLRYMHTPGEVASLDDLENAAKLIVKFIVDLNENENWIQ